MIELPKALITGASSGIGMEIAKLLSERGYSIILVARRKERLKALCASLKTRCEIFVGDLSDTENVINLCEKNTDVNIVINSAGFGVFGEFDKTELKSELSMIDVNIRAVHIITKFYADIFKKRGSGKILNVSSSASFFPGPVFSSYYASKAYITSLSLAIREELRRAESQVTVSVLCPGPVKTEFNSVSGANDGIGAKSAEYVAKKAVKGLFKGKAIILPGISEKISFFASHILHECIAARVIYLIQKKKENP